MWKLVDGISRLKKKSKVQLPSISYLYSLSLGDNQGAIACEPKAILKRPLCTYMSADANQTRLEKEVSLKIGVKLAHYVVTNRTFLKQNQLLSYITVLLKTAKLNIILIWNGEEILSKQFIHWCYLQPRLRFVLCCSCYSFFDGVKLWGCSTYLSRATPKVITTGIYWPILYLLLTFQSKIKNNPRFQTAECREIQCIIENWRMEVIISKALIQICNIHYKWYY